MSLLPLDPLQSLLADRARGFEARLLDAVQQAVIATDAQGVVVFWNAFATRLFGWSSDEAVGRPILELTPTELTRQDAEAIMADLTAGRSWAGEFTVRRKDGSEFPAFVVDSPLLDDDGRLIGIVGVSTDISRQRELERALREAAKLEAIGRVAAGVAHDFNNLLTVILGNIDDLEREPRDASNARSALQAMRDAADRAADYTGRLLAFGRRGHVQPHVVSVGAALSSVYPLLRRLTPASVEVVTQVWPDPLCVRIDATQLDQIFINLALNARDAMQSGGTLRFEVEPVDAISPRARVVPSGSFVRLSVRDTGHGMAPDVMARVFEPFFTTKAASGGSGFGLPNVYAAVSAAEGVVDIESAEGQGTTIRIVLPRVERAEPASAADLEPWPSRSQATVLVVEDDPAVRLLAQRVLLRHGYEVRVAASAAEAATVVEQSAVPIDLVLCDLVLRGESGLDVVRSLRAAHPRLRVLLMSGYADAALLDSAEATLGQSVLAKPFRPRELAEAVERALEN